MNHEFQEYDKSPDHWLNRTLKDHSPEAPNNAWERLEPFLPQTKRRKFWPFWMMGFAAAMLCLLMAIPVFFRLSTSPIQNKIHPIDHTNVPMTNVAQESYKSEFHTPLEQTDSNTIPVQSIRPTSNIAASLSVSTDAHSDKWVYSEEDNYHASAVSTGVEELSNNAPISLLATLVPSWSNTPIPPSKTVINIDFFPNKAPNSKVVISLESAPILVLQKMRHLSTAGDGDGNTNSHTGSGWQAGIYVGTTIHQNWRIGLGLQYEEQAFDVMHSNTFTIRDGICLNPNTPGLKEYEFNYRVASGNQTANYTVRLQQQHLNAAMADDEPFNVAMKTRHITQTLRIPFVLDRRFKIGKWTGFMRGGATVDVGTKTTIKVAHYDEVCEALCFQSGIAPLVTSSAKSTISVGWQAGLGVERPILPHLAFRIVPFIQGTSSAYNLGLGLHFSYSN